MNSAILVGGGGFQGLPVLRALHSIGWRVVIADSVRESLNRFEADAFCQMPEARHVQAFREALFALVEAHSAAAVFPTTMFDLPLLATLRPDLESRGVRTFASNPELISLLSKKTQSEQAFRDARLPVLPSVAPGNHDFSFPLIGKPSRGWGGTGILRAPSLAAWQEVSKGGASIDHLWQRELTEFFEWSVDFAIRASGECSPMVCRRRLRSTGGFAVVNEVAQGGQVETLALQTATWLAAQGGYGLFNIQFLQEQDGRIWLSDVNPRPGTSSVCALESGVNLVQFLLDESRMPQAPTPGWVVRTLSETFLPRLNRPIKGVVFDLDETLICQKSWMQAKLDLITTPLHREIGSESLARFEMEVMRIIDEGPWNQLIDLALERSGLPATLAGRLIALWRKAHPEQLVIHQDARAFLHVLQDLKIPTALLSDNPAVSQKQKIARLPGDLSFKAVVLTDELSAPKPDTTGFLAAASALSIPPEQLLMVGDSPWRDGLGALHAGYAGALLISRQGSMTNPLRSMFKAVCKDDYNRRIAWVSSLFGAERILNG
ncbi:HAD family hydrolase [Hydrogenophaga palleronii]|uniref:HAD family hydrolase n=1 Tax=Hydrogenophaga palleronii TaxID=65655 RepID=UPI000824A8A2|nr:HAD family hydrolase [Hydrogenophaga palleronii]